MYCYYTLYYFSRSATVSKCASYVGKIVMYSNAALDPIIYSLRNERMKRAVQKLLRIKTKSNTVAPVRNSRDPSVFSTQTEPQTHHVNVMLKLMHT